MPVKEAKLLEGKILASRIQDGIQSEIEKLVAEGKDRPRLLAIQVGNDPGSEWYLNQQEKLAHKLGIDFETRQVSKESELLGSVIKSNEDSKIHGIFITMPLPRGFNSDVVLLAVDPKKDVEGIHPTNLGLIVLRKAKLIPSTAYAAYKLLEQTGIKLWGKKATIVGQSAIVGRPLQQLLGEQRVTTIVCNTGTPETEIKKFASESDIVIACAGKPGMIRGDWIKEGAVVIDIGTTEVDGKLVGDVDFEGARQRASFITPVPGGVGPLTVTMLMQNLMHAYHWQKNS